MTHDAVQRPNVLSPLARQPSAPPPNHIKPGSARIAGAYLEAGCEDEAVDFVLLAIHDDTTLRDLIHAAPVGIDEPDIGPVERGQILVAKAWTFAELPIPGLECLSSRRVRDDAVNPRPNLVHLGEVRQLDCRGELRLRGAGKGILTKTEHDVADNVRPTVGYQILFLVPTLHQHIEILHAALLPARRQTAGPDRVGVAIVAHIHRRRRALENIQLLRVLAQPSDADRLAQAQAQIHDKTGQTVRTLVADIATEAGRQALFDGCPHLDILINNNAGPPPGQLADWDHDAWDLPVVRKPE